MVIGNLPNRQFYGGYEGESEIIFYLDGEEDRSLHIWEGYLSDILRDPNLSGQGWKGVTRDYHQCESIFSDHCRGPISIDIQEYLDDLRQYAGNRFDFEESSGCLDLLCRFLEEAKSANHSVTVEISYVNSSTPRKGAWLPGKFTRLSICLMAFTAIFRKYMGIRKSDSSGSRGLL